MEFGWIGRTGWRKIAAMRNWHGLLIAAVLLGGCVAPPKQEPVVSPAVPAPAAAMGGAQQGGGASGEMAGKPREVVAAASVGSIGLEELFGLVESGGVLLLDVRPALFHNLGHIPGSLGLPRKSSDGWIPAEEGRIRGAVSAGRPVVLYCANRECPDASAVAGKLAARGIPVKVFGGGWDEWKAAELPTE